MPAVMRQLKFFALVFCFLPGLAIAADPAKPSPLTEALAPLIAQKKHVVTYFQGSAVNDLWANKEVDIVASDITLVNQVADKGGDAAFAPMTPPLAWTCVYSIGAKAQNLDAAYALISHYLTPAVQDSQATRFSYLVSNQESAKALPSDVIANTGQDNVASYRDAATFGLPANFDAWAEVWQAVKAN